MTRNSVAASVAALKERYPQHYCPEPRCLWRTGDGSRCPRHQIVSRASTETAKDSAPTAAQPRTGGPATTVRYVRTVKPWVEARAEQQRYDMAHAAAWDAGNEHMREAGRARWNAADWNAMCAEFSRLMPEGVAR